MLKLWMVEALTWSLHMEPSIMEEAESKAAIWRHPVLLCHHQDYSQILSPGGISLLSRIFWILELGLICKHTYLLVFPSGLLTLS